jgi:hypothetical protein
MENFNKVRIVSKWLSMVKSCSFVSAVEQLLLQIISSKVNYPHGCKLILQQFLFFPHNALL